MIPRLLNWSYSVSPTVSKPSTSGQKIKRVRMFQLNGIVIDPEVLHGKPVICGTRVTVTAVVGSLAGGMSFAEVKREYDITVDDIRAALKFVTEIAGQESLPALPAA